MYLLINTIMILKTQLDVNSFVCLRLYLVFYLY